MAQCVTHMRNGNVRSSDRRVQCYHACRYLAATMVYLWLSSASAGTRKLHAAAVEVAGAASSRKREPTPARAMFFAACAHGCSELRITEITYCSYAADEEGKEHLCSHAAAASSEKDPGCVQPVIHVPLAQHMWPISQK